MSIIGWWCNKCRSRVALNHFENCDGVHPDFAAAILADRRTNEQEGVRVSHGLGCVRRYALERQANVYVDPTAYNAVVGGSAWHAFMESGSDHRDLCEVEVSGVVDGVRLSGRVDRLHPPTTISDWKTTSEWAEKWLKAPKDEGGGMKAEHLAQLSFYAELVEQSLGWRPLYGKVWYRTQRALLSFTEELWPLSKVLDFHPSACDYSVRDLLHHADQWNQWQQGRGALRCDWWDLPLVGQSIKYGNKTACDYCAVRETCYEQAYGAPF